MAVGCGARVVIGNIPAKDEVMDIILPFAAFFVPANKLKLL